MEMQVLELLWKILLGMTASNSALRSPLQGHSSIFYNAEVGWEILYAYA
jgi:hypothetical protein